MNRFRRVGVFSRTRSALLTALCLLILALPAPPAWGGARRMCLEEVVLEADVVFVGTVVDVRTRWGDGKKMIWTDYWFDVQEVWKGSVDGDPHAVSVAGGTVGEQSVLLSHVPSFEPGGTYVVYAYHNARLYAEAAVGVEQGIFREVADGETGETFLIDYFGYRMEHQVAHTIFRGRMTERVGDAEAAHVLTDQEIYYQQLAHEREREARSAGEPVYRDPEGNVVPSRKPPEPTLEERVQAAIDTTPRGEPVTREILRNYTARLLGGVEGGAAAPGSPRAKGGEE